ncbi:MAG: PIN domain-containing protein [Acidobacteriota bacterium]
MIVVDTSVLVDFFRGRETEAVRAFRQIELDEAPFSIPGICCQEVLQGAADAREWRSLLSYLETQSLVFPRDAWATHVSAARIYFDCRRRGVTLRGTLDCYIAQLVLETRGVLLHDDDDYDYIKEVRPLRTLLESSSRRRRHAPGRGRPGQPTSMTR